MLISDNEYFVSTAQEGRAPFVGRCCELWHQHWEAVERHSAAILVLEVKSHGSEWSLWSGHQSICMFAGNEFADRLAAKGAEAHQHSECTIKKIGGIRDLARAVQRRVATVTLHIAEHFPNKSIQ